VFVGAKPAGRTVKCAFVGILFTLLFGGAALAQDYTVDFAIDMHGRADTGSVECRFGNHCAVRVDSLRLKFQVVIYRSSSDLAHVTLDDDSGCCLFQGAVSALTVDPRAPLKRHRLFVGQEAGDKSLVYIQNEHVGDLYLKFQFR
jgi:hypothetical protein